MSNKKLNDKQARFVKEYVIDHNGKQAAIRAGYSEKTAESQASRLLSNAKVRAAVKGEQEKIKKRLEITVDMKRELLWNTALYASEEDVFGDDNPIVKQRNPSATVAAIKELNLMDGDHAAIKTQNEHTGKDGAPLSISFVGVDGSTD